MAAPYNQMLENPVDEEPIAELPDGYNPQPDIPLLKFLDEGNLIGKVDDIDEKSQKILTLYDDAKKSMESWRKKYKRALNLAKLQAMSGDKEINEKNFPFEGASLAMLPFILEAMLDFSSRAAPELVWTDNIVKAKVYGKNSQEKEDRAERVADYSNYQLTEMIPNWRNDQDKGLMVIAGVGTFYKETYYDPDIQEVRSDLCLADEIIFDHEYKCFDLAPDKFKECKFSRNEVIGFIRGSQKWAIEESDLEEDKNDFDFIKGYTWLDLDDDGLTEPYVVFIFKQTSKVVAVYPDFDEEIIILSDDGEIVKVESLNCLTQYRFLPDPEGGPMGMGWGILLGSQFESVNTNLRQLIDSGTLHNISANSGLIEQSYASGRGNAKDPGPIEIAQGMLTPIQGNGGGSLRDSVVQFPFSGPSPVLFQLMEYLVNSARSMTNAAVNVEASPGEAASLYLARLQQGLKLPNSITMRVYECAKEEFKKINRLNHKHYDDTKYQKVLDLEKSYSMQKDFNPEDCDIRMTADPSQGSDIERIQRAQTVYEMAKDPQQPGQVLNYRQSVLDVLDAMKTPNIDELAPEPDPNQQDPMQKMQQQMVMQQMVQLEQEKRSQDLREQELTLKQQKQAMEAAKEMTQLGLEADINEAKITQMYADSLKKLVEAGIATGDQAIEEAKRIEDQFIGDNNGSRQIPAPNPGPSGVMVRQPSNEGVHRMPGLEG